VDSLLALVEGSALSEGIRGSESVFFGIPAILTLHTIGMGFLAGGSAAIDLRILGFAPQIPLKTMGRFFPVLWLALIVNVASGILLLIAYPTKALTNPLFYLKLGLIALALTLVRRIGAIVLWGAGVGLKPVGSRVKLLAFISIMAWIAVITAGRLLAYTHKWELLGVRAVI
jgi:hypothetical protein